MERFRGHRTRHAIHPGTAVHSAKGTPATLRRGDDRAAAHGAAGVVGGHWRGTNRRCTRQATPRRERAWMTSDNGGLHGGFSPMGTPNSGRHHGQAQRGAPSASRRQVVRGPPSMGAIAARLARPDARTAPPRRRYRRRRPSCPSGQLVVPSRGVEHLALESLDSGNRRGSAKFVRHCGFELNEKEYTGAGMSQPHPG